MRSLQRLQRLEQRVTGAGVTESEARNALRLFERELGRANWSSEKFERLGGFWKYLIKIMKI